MGEGGRLLSGGQQTRLALARVLLRDPTCVLVDEVTSALDAENEHDVLQALESVRSATSSGPHGRTIVAFTHSAAMMKMADQLIAFVPQDSASGDVTYSLQTFNSYDEYAACLLSTSH